MNNIGKWIVTAMSPLGDEEYDLTLEADGRGEISHPKGGVNFSNTVFSPNGITDIYGTTEVPMTTTFRLKILFSDSAGAGTLYIGDFAEIPLKARRP